MWETTGHADDAKRVEEAKRILAEFEEALTPELRERMGERNSNFLAGMLERAEIHEELRVSPKQLFWLRDLRERYL